MNVEIMGVNKISSAIDQEIHTTTGNNILPFLQDTKTNQVWALWGVTYRDVRILDSSNRLVAVYNLSVNDLTTDAKYSELVELLASVANQGDQDHDGLPDAWEQRYLHSLDSGKDDDPDHDGFSNYMEFAFGSDPLDANSRPSITSGFNASHQFTISFNRWAGTPLDYLVESTTNLTSWSSSPALLRMDNTNLYDGSGRLRTTYNLRKAVSVIPYDFIRVNAAAKP